MLGPAELARGGAVALGFADWSELLLALVGGKPAVVVSDVQADVESSMTARNEGRTSLRSEIMPKSPHQYSVQVRLLSGRKVTTLATDAPASRGHHLPADTSYQVEPLSALGLSLQQERLL